jgi:competence protein ComEA
VAARVRVLLATPDDLDGGDDPGFAPPAATLGQRLAARLRALPFRVDPGRRSALAVGLAVLVAALVTGGWVLLDRPRPVPVAAQASSLPASATPVGTRAPSVPLASIGSASAAPPAQVAGSGAPVVVDVAGKVRHPGLYRLASGSRIDDAVRSAGGALHGVDLSGLNLAAKVVDGQQILVGAPPGVAPPVGTASASGSGAVAGAGSTVAGAPVDLNSASLEQLQTLPGVGPVLGQHILDWRTAHGSFTSVQQLDDVPGIGTVKFAALQPLVTV